MGRHASRERRRVIERLPVTIGRTPIKDRERTSSVPAPRGARGASREELHVGAARVAAVQVRDRRTPRLSG